MSTQLVERTPSMFSLSPYSLNDHHHHHHHHSTSTHSYQPYDPINSAEQNLYISGHIPSHQHSSHSSYPTPYTSPPSRMRTATDSNPSSSTSLSFNYSPFLTKSPKFIDQPSTTTTTTIMNSSTSSPPPTTTTTTSTSTLSSCSSRLSTDNQPTITMFLTIEGLECAKVSDECLCILGYYPSELINRSLYNYITLEDGPKLQRLINTLLGRVHRYPSLPFVTSDDQRFSRINPENLQYSAYGSTGIDVSDMISLKQRNGQYDLYNVRMYLGGGLGANLNQKETWNELYIVAHFTRVKLEISNSNSLIINDERDENNIRKSGLPEVTTADSTSPTIMSVNSIVVGVIGE
ncbi:1832_t:CDS:2 [Diversispora eburnea]|uniref:1832_t:CDS:1 n=1 Tax=Diversispora eburnea TaxID=1213867 RepID=A0A9N8V964_9GLOM|nr:1832_t:CDS:2 [Diversispora eburnea]